MTIDFRASQIQVRQLIASGTIDGSAGDQLVIYPKGSTTDNEGGIGFDTSALSGSDIFVYVSGSSDSKGSPGNNVWVFGGDTHTSGVNHSDRISSFQSDVTGAVDGPPGGTHFSTIINSYYSVMSGSILSTMVAGYQADLRESTGTSLISSKESGIMGSQFSSMVASSACSVTGSSESQIAASRESTIDTPSTAALNSIVSSFECGIAGSFPFGMVILGSRESLTKESNHFSSIISSLDSEMANSVNSSVFASSNSVISASDLDTSGIEGRNNTIIGSANSEIVESILGKPGKSSIVSSVSGTIEGANELVMFAASEAPLSIASYGAFIGATLDGSIGLASYSSILASRRSAIGLGDNNFIAATTGSAIYGSQNSFVKGGIGNRVSASNNSGIVGGNTNSMISSSNGLVLGGNGNNNNSSTGSIIFGGFSNTINAGNYSYAMGQNLGITTATTIKIGGSTYSTNVYGPTTFTNKGSGVRGGLHTHTPAAFYQNILAESGSYGSGVAGEFIGSHQRLNLLGDPAFLAGPNITLVTNSLGQIEISGSGGGSTSGSIGIAVSPTVTGSSNVDSVSYEANDIVFQHVGNVITYAGTITATPVVSGTSAVVFDMGSIVTSLPDNVIAGVASVIAPSSSNVTSTALVGIDPAQPGAEMSIVFDAVDASAHKVGFSIVGYTSSSAGSHGSGLGTSGPTRTNVGSYLLTTADEGTPQTAGAGYYKSDEHDSINYILRAILSTTTGSNSAYVKLLNASTNNFVEIGGPGIEYLSTNSTSASLVESVNLYGAANFTDDSVYQVMVYGSGSAPTTVHYSSEIVFL